MCVSVGGRNGIGGGLEGRVMVRSKRCKEGCSLRTFSSSNTPREGSRVGEAGECQEGMGVQAPPVNVSTRRLQSPWLCSGP